MKFKNRLYVFFASYLFFPLFIYFNATLWGLVFPLLGLIYLIFGGFIHDRLSR